MAFSSPMDSNDGVAKILSDEYFRDLASKLGTEKWLTLAAELDLRKSEIEQLKKDHQSVRDQIFNMFVKWRQNIGPNLHLSHVNTLVQSLKTVNQTDLAVKLEVRTGELSNSETTHHGNTNVHVKGDKNTTIVGAVKDSTFHFH
ncbi:uncharacterized protein [Asterias amurensis]|uniref:uncharacterized protein n=1 Tax=Asterias amurensis TaxID=7602 RepID=UPI003AB4F415